MGRVLTEPRRPAAKQQPVRRTVKAPSALEEDIRYRIPQHNEEAEALQRLRKQEEELRRLQEESNQTHTVFTETERASFSKYKTGGASVNRFRALLSNPRSLRDAVVLSEIIQRKYS